DFHVTGVQTCALPIYCKKGEFIFWLAGLPISDVSFSSNFKATILFVEKDLLTKNLPSANASIDSYIHSKENPILHPEKDDKEKRSEERRVGKECRYEM